jgi:hypothetical protein
MQLDIIGDVHGHADPLQALLRKLGYRDTNGAWRHPGGRRAVFVGDLIDRGPSQLETISIARRMADAGTALLVMGNHEFNAIAFATPDPAAPGQHLRPRRGNNIHHHAVFLDAAGGPDTPLHRDLVAFFLTMPLWLDLPGIRVIHACWSASAMAALGPHLDRDHRLTEAGFLATQAKGSAAYTAAEILLKGPEMTLPEGVWYRDAQGSKRRKARMRWWDPLATTLRSACAEESVAAQLPDEALPQHNVIALDPSQPLFFGHYWLRGEPFILAPRRTCLDFSIAKGGTLCAYRFDGETTLDASKLVWTA